MKRILLLMLVLVWNSCETVEQSPKPDPFFDQDKMSNILVDMYLIEGSQSSNRKSFLKTSIRPDSFLYKKYEMDSLIYQQNFHYYADRADEYLELLETTEDKLVKIKEEVLSKARLEAEEKRIADSIQIAKAKANQSDDLIKLIDSSKANRLKERRLKVKN